MDNSLEKENTWMPLNIDSMLWALSSKSASETKQETLWTTFNIDSLTKPNPPASPVFQDVWSLNFSSPPKVNSFKLPGFVKKTMIWLLTLLILIGWSWFMSIQYPLEFQDYTTKLSWFFWTTLSTIRNNIDGETSLSWSLSSSDMFNLTGVTNQSVEDIYSDSETPLADAITQEQDNPTVLTTTTSQTFDSALYESWVSMSGSLSGSSETLLGDLPWAEEALLVNKQQLRDGFILAKQTADIYIAQSAGVAQPLKLSIAKAVSKKAESLSLDLEDASADMDLMKKELEQLNALLERLKE